MASVTDQNKPPRDNYRDSRPERGGRHRIDDDYDDYYEAYDGVAYDDQNYDRAYDDANYEARRYDDARYDEPRYVDAGYQRRAYDGAAYDSDSTSSFPVAETGAGLAGGAAAAGAAGAMHQSQVPAAQGGDYTQGDDYTQTEYMQGNYAEQGNYPDQDDYHGAYPAAAGAAEPQVAEEDEETPKGAGLPLRGLAALLILIGIGLIGFGIYAVTAGSDDEEDTTAATTATEAPATEGTPDPAQPGQENPEVAPEAQDPAAPGAADPAAPENPEAAPAEQPAPAPAPAEPGAVDRNIEVTVLNNSSTGRPIAGETADRLRGEGWTRVGSANLPGEQARYERTTVTYDPADHAAQAAAEQIAHDNGWEAAPRDQRLDGQPGGVVIVLTNDA